ncbi:cytosine deaminase [Phaeobacter sp. PT47_59]|uniref:cytosine deaminase n=1 Tax=Phaeobacter sp. PT47_59 TaxID=3029979 RepID=UPI0023802CB8|nr:cytosine deaminase [Phaeobacter sp. PT47_59]MDE4175341.1 cytosine deaminase [Phaeobacter sp. PT47_59]
MDFKTLPTGEFTLQNVTVPACALGQEGDLSRTSITVRDGKIAAIGTAPEGSEAIDMKGAFVMPAFVDAHTHLDKGHILPRASNPDGTFWGAKDTVAEDHANWKAEDVFTRADFSLRCAYAHGTKAIRTHLDCIPPQDEISWPVLSELREKWAGKITLQGSSLSTSIVTDIDGRFLRTADLVAEHGGVLGMVTLPMDGLDAFLRRFFEIAAERGLDTDFHVDETMDPSFETLRDICAAKLATGYSGRVQVGHLCSLSTQVEARALDTLDKVAEAGLDVVSLPMCNMYLQDRNTGRTPRGRGVTLVHEMKARGIPVSFASDNTRDPFYAYGDLDMLEVMREATRIAHLDHSDTDWFNAFTATPAAAMGLDVGQIIPGAPADLVIARARTWTELMARPQSDRIVLRDGVQIDRTLPDYAELDHLFEA